MINKDETRLGKNTCKIDKMFWTKKSSEWNGLKMSCLGQNQHMKVFGILLHIASPCCGSPLTRTHDEIKKGPCQITVGEEISELGDPPGMNRSTSIMSQPELEMERVEQITCINVFAHDGYRVRSTCDPPANDVIPLKDQVALVAR